ncbi:MAG: sugar ABC transporter permease [Oscillospiraceae bacterium]|jgi:multiple sugar transport system permease protein|nr:sugar ABC transporter permease [Oscillospiraceae bacterium]
MKQAVDYKLKLGYRMRKSYISYVMMTPFLVAFLFFTVLPVLAAVLLSFTDFNMLQLPQITGFDNYKRLFLEDEVFLTAVKNTMILTFVNGPIGYLVAFLLAWLINEMPNKARVIITFIFYAPSISGNVYFIWKFLFSGDAYGFINGFLMRMGFINEPVLWLTNVGTAMVVVILVQFWTSLGASFLAFIAGFQSVDRSQYEAAAIDGVRNRFGELWYVTIPNMKPMLLFGAVMLIANTFSVGAVTDELTGGHMSIQASTLTIVNHMTDYGSVRYEMGYASAIAVILFLLVYFSKRLIFRLLRW